MSEECKVPLFGYFQVTQQFWYNYMVKGLFESALDSINKNFKEQLDELKKQVEGELYRQFDDIQKNDTFDRSNVTSLITKLNTLSMKYVNNNYEISIDDDLNALNAAMDKVKILKDALAAVEKSTKSSAASQIADLESKQRGLKKEISRLEELIKENKINNDDYNSEKNISIKDFETQISQLQSDITKIDVSILELIAKMNLAEIKSKHYKKLLDSHENEFKLTKIVQTGENKFLELQLRQLEEELKKNDEEEIVRVLTAEFNKKNREKMNEKEFTSNIGSSNVNSKGWLDQAELDDGKYPITEKDLYDNNTYYQEIKRIISGEEAISDQKSKIFSKPYTNVLTVDSKTINDKLAKL